MLGDEVVVGLLVLLLLLVQLRVLLVVLVSQLVGRCLLSLRVCSSSLLSEKLYLLSSLLYLSLQLEELGSVVRYGGGGRLLRLYWQVGLV